MSNVSQWLDVTKIMKMLPHRYPMLLVDRVLEIKPDVGIKAIKNVTINEDFFNGHFPGHPVMPGVLIVEAMAQAAGIFVIASTDDIDVENTIVYFMSIEEAQFRKPVVPGDTIVLEIEKIKNRGAVWKMKGEVKVEGVRVANATFSAMLLKNEK
jgi:3-hydroxyacyl-[acyl-carrier-protein] dehydratase